MDFYAFKKTNKSIYHTILILTKALFFFYQFLSNIVSKIKHILKSHISSISYALKTKLQVGKASSMLKKVTLLLLPLVMLELEMAQGFASADKVREIPHIATYPQTQKLQLQTVLSNQFQRVIRHRPIK